MNSNQQEISVYNQKKKKNKMDDKKPVLQHTIFSIKMYKIYTQKNI